MKKFSYLFLLSGLVIGTQTANAQIIGGKKNKTQVETNSDEKAKFDNDIKEKRVQARANLKPYRYSGTKSTTFVYKSHDYNKEIEISTIEKVDYKFSFNSEMVKYGNIGVKIYDKPSGSKGRIELYSNDDVGGGDFIVSTDDLNATFREKKIEKGTDPALAEKMRLKKVFVVYEIPAVDRDETITTDAATNGQESVRVVKYSAMIIAVGYKYE